VKPTTPQDLRATLVKSYLTSYQRAGIKKTEAEVEREVVSDMQIVDAARARGEISGGPTFAPGQAVVADPPERDPVLVQYAESNKLTIGRRGRTLRFRSLHTNPMTISARWGAAVARIARILEGCAKSTSLVAAVEGAELGQLATEYFEVYSNYPRRHQPPPPSGNDRNPFRGLSDKDASRKFMRLVEDICDRSTGKLGSWYVK
jgi:hypothetical protein